MILKMHGNSAFIEMRKIVIFIPASIGGIREVSECIGKSLQSQGYTIIISRSIFSLIYKAIALAVHNKQRPYGLLALECGFVSFLFKRSIYILHGFPVKPYYGILREKALIESARTAKIMGAKLSAVSYLTRNVFQRIYAVSVDETINNGVSQEYLCLASHVKKKQILYIGRLSPNKGIEKIISIFNELHLGDIGYMLCIAGGGELESYVQAISDTNPSIIYRGRVDENEKKILYQESEIFASLNDFEPFGVTYIEALMSRCKVIVPHGSGIIDYISVSPFCFACDPLSSVDLKDCFERAIKWKPDPYVEALPNKHCFDYDLISRKYLDLLLS